MSKTLTQVGIFLLALAASLWATVSITREPIERDLTHRCEEALAEIEGLRTDYCKIEFVGRDGKLTGEVQTPSAKDEAEKKLAGLHGVRVIESSLTVRPFDQPWIELVRGEDSIDAKGLLSSASELRGLGRVLDSLPGTPQVDDQVEVREKVEAADWLPDALPVVRTLLSQADGAVVKLRKGRVSLSGEMPDADAKEELVALADAKFNGSGISKQITLTVAPPPEPSGFEMKPAEDGKLVVSGRVADLATSERLLKVLRSTDLLIEDQIVVAENTLEALWADSLLLLLPSVLNEVAGAGIKIENQIVRLEGQIDSDGMFEAIGELAKQNFPEPTYIVQNRLKIMAPPREPMVSIISFPDGRLRLKGLLGEEEHKERVVAAVRGAVPSIELLTEDLVVEENVMAAPWIDALVQMIPPYTKQVKRGGLTINSNILAVEAEIESEEERDLLWAMTEHHFPDEEYRRFLELRFPEEVEGGIAGEDDGSPE